MLKSHLVVGTYNHLPEGLGDSEFETVYQTCYRPFLSTLNRFPEIQATLFYSGSLLSRLESRHPEYLMLLEEMSARRQIELLGGGFYAPILPLIPSSDRLGQIELLTTYLRKNFGKRPRGCWLAEYAWEPSLASTLQTSGMDYTFLSIRQFEEAYGRRLKEPFPVVTEDQGRCVTVLPTVDCSSSLGSPVGLVEAAEAVGSTALTVLMVPGERISQLWEASGLESPDLYMEQTFAWFRKNSLESETTTPSRFLKSKRATTRLYFTGTASERFMKASCPEGGDWRRASPRGNVIRYASASALYSKMSYVHLLIGQLRGDKSRKKSAAEDLWKGQCGDAYWLAPSGGLDAPTVRESAYRSLIDAELTTRQKGAFVPGIVKADIDFDGIKEYIYQAADQNAYVHARGASLHELDALKARRNVCDVFFPAQDDDAAHKACFIDRLYAEEPGPEAAAAPWKADIGPFCRSQYEETQLSPDQPTLCFSRDGVVGLGGSKRAIAVTKRYSFAKRLVKVSYGVQNRSDADARFWFGVEFNLSAGADGLENVEPFPGDASAQGLRDPSLNESLGTVSKLTVRLKGALKAITISTIVPAKAMIAPIGPGANQGLAVLLAWPMAFGGDETWKNDVSLSFGE